MHRKLSFLAASTARSSNRAALVFGLAMGLFGSLGVLIPTASAQTGTWESTGSMTTPRLFFSATLLLDGKVLVAGGVSTRFGGFLSSAELYDPRTGKWTLTASMGKVRYSHTASLLPDGKVLVAGGYDNTSILASSELYDPSTKAWTPTGSMSTPRGQHMATLITVSPLLGRLLVAGGNQGPPLDSAELYDPSTGSWSATGSMRTASFDPRHAMMPDGSVLVVDGATCCPYENFNSAETYDPATQMWTSTREKVTTANAVGRTTVMPNGQVMVAGGRVGVLFNHSKTVAAAELFDLTDGWNRANSMATDRALNTLTILANGQVLTAGGFQTFRSGCTDLSSAELYDSNDEWQPAGNMATARYWHEAILLPNSKVLVAGGLNCADIVFSSAELYHPAP